MIKIGEEIQALRKRRKLTQETLAEQIGISTTHMGYIEQGKREPPLKILQKIAGALGVLVKDLISF